MSETNEPSYYEIALTNRQVLVSFVILLSCVLAAFVSGVWMGRKGSVPVLPSEEQTVVADAEAADIEQLEEFKLLSERQAGGEHSGGDEPAENVPPDIADQPRPKTTLAQDVGSSPPPRGTPSPRNSSPPARRSSPDPPAPIRQPAPRPKPPPPPTTTVSTESTKVGFVIQVLSTRDEARAKRVLAQLRKGGYKAFLSPVQVGTQVNNRVRIGPFSKRPPAEKVAREVSSKYKLDTWITAASN